MLFRDVKTEDDAQVFIDAWFEKMIPALGLHPRAAAHQLRSYAERLGAERMFDLDTQRGIKFVVAVLDKALAPMVVSNSYEPRHLLKV